MEVIFPLNNFFFVARSDRSQSDGSEWDFAMPSRRRADDDDEMWGSQKESSDVSCLLSLLSVCVLRSLKMRACSHIPQKTSPFFYSIEKITRTWSINSQLNSQTDVLVLFELYRKNQFLMVAEDEERKKNPPDWNDWSRIDNNYYPLFSLTFKDAREELRQQQMAWSISRRACT